MRIMRLELRNFRGIKELDIDFAGKDTNIYGANGSGKTTIANAICWLLLDRPATEEKDFDPKTTNAHNLRHAASITIERDGQVTTLSKEYYELWTKKKGSPTAEFSGHTTDYAINGVPAKKKEYQATVESLCGLSLDKIKMLMIHGYFTDDLSTEERRNILFAVCGDVSDIEVLRDPELADLGTYLQMPGTKGQQYSTDEYKKIAVEQRLKINKELELLPARIDEVNNGIPDELPNETVLTKQLTELEEQKAELEREKQDLQSKDGNADVLRKKISELKTEYAVKQAEYLTAGNKENEDVNREIEAVQKEKADLSFKIRDAEADIKRFDVEIKRMNEQREWLLKEYAEVQAKQWEPKQETCQTCGQLMPAERIEEMRKAFNLKQSALKEDINQRGQSCSQQKIKELESEKGQSESAIVQDKSLLQAVEEKLQKLRSSLVTRPSFESTEEAKQLQAAIEDLQEQQQNSTAAATEVIKLQDEKIAEVVQQIREVNRQFGVMAAAEESKKRIESLTAKQRDKAAELEKLEYGIHLCEEYTRIKARMITDKINSRFTNVHFQLFEDQINGGLKEICDPTVQNKAGEWVRYKSVNTAAKVNAELEIIDVLNQHYNTNLPVIMDRAESVSQPIAINEQLIRLIVSPIDTVIRVEN